MTSERKELTRIVREYAIDVCSECGERVLAKGYGCTRHLSAESEVIRVVPAVVTGETKEGKLKDLRGVQHRHVHRDDAVVISGAEYLSKGRRLDEAAADADRLCGLISRARRFVAGTFSVPGCELEARQWLEDAAREVARADEKARGALEAPDA